MGFQYREPPEDKSFMRPEEYDEFIADEELGFTIVVAVSEP